MKFLVISDIHGSADYMEKALEAYTRHKPDQILLLGDILYHGPRNPLPQGYNPQKVAALLNPLADKIIAVRGNCDAEVDQMLLIFSATARPSFWADTGLRRRMVICFRLIRPRTASPAISICLDISTFLSFVRKTELRCSIPARSRCQNKIHRIPTDCWTKTDLRS